MKDERIEQAKNKIRSEMAVIILYGAALSFTVKIAVFHMSLMESLTEYLILIFFPIYQFIRMHMMKVSIYSERGNKQSIKNLILTLFILVAAYGAIILGSKKPLSAWYNSILFLIVFIALFVAVFFISNRFNQSRGHKYEKEFDDD